MIRNFIADGGRLKAAQPTDLPATIIWTDLLTPSVDEVHDVETQLGIDVPTKEEMAEIEPSSRLYVEGDALFMTATLPAKSQSEDPEIKPVTFILTGQCLVTVRHHEPQAFTTLPARAEKIAMGCTSGHDVLAALMDILVDRLADALEKKGHEIKGLSRTIFRRTARTGSFQDILDNIGEKGDTISGFYESLVSLERLLGFLRLNSQERKDLQERIETLAKDVTALAEHAEFLSQKVSFLLDATLGMINIEQSNITKIFSVVTVVFLPATLIASIYGMNFEHIPELKFAFGYPLALVAMVVAAILPYLYFKRRSWL